jgi:hypothetical protein
VIPTLRLKSRHQLAALVSHLCMRKERLQRGVDNEEATIEDGGRLIAHRQNAVQDGRMQQGGL